MGRIGEEVESVDATDRVPRVDKVSRIARQRRDVARDVDDCSGTQAGDTVPRLPRETGAGRIENERVRADSRRAREMLDRLANGHDPAMRRHGIRLEVQGAQSIAFDGGDACPAGQRGPDGPQTRARVEVDDGAALLDQSNDVPDKVAYQGTGCPERMSARGAAA